VNMWVVSVAVLVILGVWRGSSEIPLVSNYAFGFAVGASILLAGSYATVDVMS